MGSGYRCSINHNKLLYHQVETRRATHTTHQSPLRGATLQGIPMTENIVKHACEVLGVTRKQLADLIGVSKSSVDTWSAKGAVSISAERALKLLIELHELKKLTNSEELEKNRERLAKLDELERLERENALLKGKIEKIAEIVK